LVEPLDDDALVWHTFIRYSAIERDEDALRVWLDQTFGDVLAEAHDDERGVFVYPDIAEPRARTYEGILAETSGLWVPLSDDPKAMRHAAAYRKHRDAEQDTTSKLLSGGVIDIESMLTEGDDLDAQALVATMEKMGLLNQNTAAPARLVTSCYLINRKTPLVLSEDEVNESVALPDGATFVHTTDLLTSADDAAFKLAEDYAAWVDEHDDPRGVPCFGASHADKVKRATSYEAALEELGSDVTFVTPRGLEARAQDRARRLEKLLSGGS